MHSIPKTPMSVPNALEHVVHLFNSTLTPELFLQLPHRMPNTHTDQNIMSTYQYSSISITFSTAFTLQIRKAMRVSGCTKCGAKAGVLEAAAVAQWTWIYEQVGSS